MKIELLTDLDDLEFTNGELVRIFDFNTSQLKVLRDALKDLMTTGEPCSTETLPIKGIDGCRIQFLMRPKNIGLYRNANGDLICALNSVGYETFIAKFDQQINGGSGHHWLDEFIDSPEISLLLSEGGGW